MGEGHIANGDLGYTGIYFIDNFESQIDYDDFLINLRAFTRSHVPSFYDVDYWLDSTNRVVLENRLYQVCVCSDSLYTYVRLVPLGNNKGLESKNLKKYCFALEKALLNLFPEIYFPVSSWTRGTIKREDIFKQ